MNIKDKLYYLPFYLLLFTLPKIIGFVFASNGKITDYLSLFIINLYYASVLIVFISFLISKKRASEFHKNALVNFLLLSLSSIFIVLILEGAARLLADREELSYQRLGGVAYRQTLPLPLQNASYDVKWFVQNSDSVPLNIYNDTPYSNAKRLGVSKNSFYKMENGRRYTTDNPLTENTNRKLYIFGGSTIFCRGVPDTLTLPSYLRRYLSDEFPNMKVINCGVPGVSTPAQLDNLKVLKDSLRECDVVIFYDGVNDALSRLATLENDFKDEKSDSIVLSKILSFISKLKQSLYLRLKEESLIVYWLLYPYKPQKPPLITKSLHENPLFLKGVDSTSHLYVSNIKEAYLISREKNTQFFHFLQPQVASRNPNTEFEQKTIDNPYNRIKYDIEYFKLAYPSFRENLDSIRVNGKVMTYDISNVFNQYEGEVFIDNCHVSQEGNRIVAEKIYELIKDKVKSCSKD